MLEDERFRHEEPASPQGHCNLSFRRGELFPLRDALFYDMPIRVPAQAEKVLARSLGPDYMTAGRIRRGDAEPCVRIRIEDYHPA